MPLYGQAGVPEAWVVDLAEKRAIVYKSPTPQGYREVRVALRGETMSPESFPERQVGVAALLS